MKECIFCKIVRKETDARIVYEDDFVMAILDSDPITDGHTLILPKKDVLDIHSLDAETGLHVMQAAKIIADVLKNTFQFESVSLMQTNGFFQDVPHFHLHVFGRSKKQNIAIQYPEGVLKEATHLDKNASMIKNAIGLGGD